jgi:hypothetical protein
VRHRDIIPDLDRLMIDLDCTRMHLDDLKDEIEALKNEIIKQENLSGPKDALELRGIA